MTLWDICIRRPIFTAMLVSAPVVLGIASYARLGVDLFPNVDLPIVTVTTTLRGAAQRRHRLEDVRGHCFLVDGSTLALLAAPSTLLMRLLLLLTVTITITVAITAATSAAAARSLLLPIVATGRR